MKFNIKLTAKILAFVGAALAIILGLSWMSDYFAVQDQIKSAGRLLKNSAVKAQLSALTKLYLASYVLLLGGIASIAATIMIEKFQEKSAYVMLGVPLLAALLAPQSLVFTIFLAAAGGMYLKIYFDSSFLVKFKK